MITLISLINTDLIQLHDDDRSGIDLVIGTRKGGLKKGGVGLGRGDGRMGVDTSVLTRRGWGGVPC